MTAPGTTDMISELDDQFARLYRNACELASFVHIDGMQETQDGSHLSPLEVSYRENVLRGLAAVEQTFGGITANLWDDPFEWTLPETLNSRDRLFEYLVEVEETRLRAFASLGDDGELQREIVVPSGQRQTLLELFRQTISRVIAFQTRAFELRNRLKANNS
jgi:hypothetical protein